MQRQRSVIHGVVGLIAMCALTAIGGFAQAVSSNGPYYAEPSWSQKLPVATRFVVLTDWNNEVVLDRETGLVWEVAPQAAAVNWNDARRSCVDKAVGGRKGWRLPSVTELVSLVDPIKRNPALPTGHPFIGVVSRGYWSAGTNLEDRTAAWTVDINNGNVTTFNKINGFQVWCVRGGMNADQY